MYTLRITLKSINQINFFQENLLKLRKKKTFKNIKIKGFFYIQKKKKIFTVLKSPHVNKKSREQFIYQNYNKKIDIKFNNFFQLLNFLLLIKKIFVQNLILKTKIMKN